METKNIICIIHCGNIHIFNEIIESFQSISKMRLIITYHDDDYKKMIENHGLNIIKMMKTENKGMDIGPFLLTIKFLYDNNSLYNENTIFFKIHTKKNDVWRNSMINDIINFNSEEFINDVPILYASDKYIYKNKNVIKKDIINRNFPNYNMNEHFDIYYDNCNGLFFSDIFYKYYENDLKECDKFQLCDHWNKHGKYEKFRKSNVNFIDIFAKKKNYFVAGTIFIFNMKWLYTMKYFNLNYEYSLLERGYTRHIDYTNVHSFEYLFGFMTYLRGGKIVGMKNSAISNIYDCGEVEDRPKFSMINKNFDISKIAIFMIPPGASPDSGGYRTLLNYINVLNNAGHVVDLYFGITNNDIDIINNVYRLNKYGIPECANWFNANYNIFHIIKNITKYNIIDIKKNNFFIGLLCQKRYDVLIANAWQIAKPVYINRKYAKHIYYIIQDREELFYNEDNIRKKVIDTYKKEFKYYCITNYLYNYFKTKYTLPNVIGSCMGIDVNKYYDKNKRRELSVAIPYYANKKLVRQPILVTKIIEILSSKNIKCYIFPYRYESMNENIINMGTLNENELNDLYNKCKVGIIFSNSNPSRLTFEMYASGLHVIEYDCEYTEHDVPSKYFTKIKCENNIYEIVSELFNKSVDMSFLNKIDITLDYENFLRYIMA